AGRGRVGRTGTRPRRPARRARHRHHGGPRGARRAPPGPGRSPRRPARRPRRRGPRRARGRHGRRRPSRRERNFRMTSPFRQPRAVWAVAFACVISFMGIGLVDPILPALSTQLHATPSQVTLLFTSYLVVTAVAMLVTGWVSSRIGAKSTLIAGLVLIVVFAGLAGATDTIGGIVGFRAGWGLGNALFIATSLAVIVGSATGGFAGAIVLYETALGIGIACGPLLGAALGNISWRGPFFGVSVLMAIALVATVLFVPRTPRPAAPAPLSAPLTALLYNWGFFTMLGYVPFPMHLSIYGLGAVFFGWGLLVAVFSVFVAPRLQGRFGTAPTLYGNLALFALVLAVIAA